MEGAEKPVILLIADISGYTRFMFSNRETLAHGQVIITDLLKAILKKADLPLEVAKLEGDAVFLYVEKDSPELRGEAAGTLVARKLPELYDAFCDQLEELARGNLCHCAVCKSISLLRLKIIVHSGTALFYSIGKFDELSGADVITLHRLVKNSVKGNQYILMTEDAYHDLRLGDPAKLVRGVERYPDIGKVATYTFFPSRIPLAGEEAGTGASFWYKFGREWAKYCKALPYRFGLKKAPPVGLEPAEEPG